MSIFIKTESKSGEETKSSGGWIRPRSAAEVVDPMIPKIKQDLNLRWWKKKININPKMAQSIS